MLVSELYSLTKNIMFEKSSSKDYDNYYIPNINRILAELFDLNNNLRESKGMDTLDTIPAVGVPSDTLPYEEEINRNVMPLGLASRFFIDDDLSKYSIFNTDYLNAQIMVMKGIETEITDVIGNVE